MKRRSERRDSCDRCLAMKLKEEMASRGSDIEPMPSRAYLTTYDTYVKGPSTDTSPVHEDFPHYGSRSRTSPPAATSPTLISPIFTETLPTPNPLFCEKYHELDVEQRHFPYTPTTPREPQYRFEESDDDDEIPPPTPPPKPQYREPEERPRLPKLDVRPFKRPNGYPKLGDDRRDEMRLGAPSRAYSISSYYYDNGNDH